MANNNSVNLDINNNADGFDISGGTTKRTLSVTGSDVTLTGSGSNTYTMPASSDTIVGRASADTLTNKTFGDDIVFDEASDHSSTPSASKGYLWVRNDNPNVLVFTDDSGADTVLGGTASTFNSLTDTDLTSVAQGDILYYDGTDWVNLGPGTSGQVLTTNGAAANPSWTTAGAGDVTKVGTPVDQQVGVWTGDGTLEGNDGLTFVNESDSGFSTDQLFIGKTDNDAGVGLNVQDDGAGAGALFARHQDSTGGPAIYSYKGRGTGASPSAVQSGDSLGEFLFRGYDGSTYETTAEIEVEATENFGASNEGTHIEIKATANGDTSRTTYLTIGGASEIELGGYLDANAHAIGDSTLTDNGNSGSADTIDWGVGNNQESTLTANCTYTFTAPSVKGRFSLIVKQDATGSRTVTWPAAVKWPGGTAPTLSTAANAVDIISFLYDGTNYYGVDTLNFS